MNISYRYGPEVSKHAAKITEGTISDRANTMGILQGEPLIVMMDCLIKYAQAYRKRFGGPLADDGVLGDPWLDAAKGVRALLNGDGAIALERGITTDSKDNGVVEGMFWDAMEAAGHMERDL